MQRYPDEVEFTVTCRMRKRWVPHFQSMLCYMEELGNMGSSRLVSFVSDGDGDYRPKFKFDGTTQPDILAAPIRDSNGDRTYDAG